MKTLPVNTGVDSVSPPRAHPSTGSQSGSATPVWTVLIELGGGLPNFSYCLSILDPAVTGERASALLDLRRPKSPNTANLHLNSIALRRSATARAYHGAHHGAHLPTPLANGRAVGAVPAVLGDSGRHGLCESALGEAGGAIGDGSGGLELHIDDAATLVLDLMRGAIRRNQRAL